MSCAAIRMRSRRLTGLVQRLEVQINDQLVQRRSGLLGERSQFLPNPPVALQIPDVDEIRVFLEVLFTETNPVLFENLHMVRNHPIPPSDGSGNLAVRYSD